MILMKKLLKKKLKLKIMKNNNDKYWKIKILLLLTINFYFF